MKILLVDDHPIFLEGLKNLLLARGLDVVDTANGGEEALEKASRLLPDVVLMDIFMKPLSGLQTTRLIKVKLPQIKIIMLTAAETDEELFEAVKSGASGYLLKSLDSDVLYEMLVQYEQGVIPVSPGLATKLLEEFKRNDKDYRPMKEPLSIKKQDNDKFSRLSPRQKDVLIMVAGGMKYKDIALQLGITERTVKYYMETILDKLHMENRNQAVKYMIQEGIVK